MIATGGELSSSAGRTRWGCRPRAGSTSTRCGSASPSIEDHLHRTVVGPARVAGGAAAARDGPAQGAARGRRRDGGRDRGARGRLRRGRDRARGPRIPDLGTVDGERILTTRQAYPPPEIPEHVGDRRLGGHRRRVHPHVRRARLTGDAVVSRQQVLPMKDPEVAAVLEDEFLRRGVSLLKGARASAIERTGDVVRVSCNDGRVVEGSHVVLAVGSIPNTEELGLDEAGVETDEGGYIPINHNCLSNVEHIYAAGDVSGKLPLSSVAAMQGRKIAEHLMGLHNRPHRHLDYEKAASAIFTEPGDRRRRPRRGRGVRVRPQDPGDEGAVLGERQGAHQGRPARVREDHLRPGDRRRARRIDRRAQRRRAHQRDRGRGDERPEGRTTSSTRSSCTPPSPSPSPTPRRDR